METMNGFVQHELMPLPQTRFGYVAVPSMSAKAPSTNSSAIQLGPEYGPMMRFAISDENPNLA